LTLPRAAPDDKIAAYPEGFTMQLTLEKIKEAASQLPDGERAELLEFLWQSLEQIEWQGFSPEYLAEIERRCEEIDSGAVVGIPWEEVDKEMERIIDEARGVSSARSA
jgi:putative addiction module component (TIGR02574 family)